MTSVAQQSPVNILVVDDDDVDREKILRLLKKIPIAVTVTEGNSAQDALRLMHDHAYDCAILDYQLQDALGSELVEAIHQHNPAPVPIIMVSGNSDERVVANVMRDGVFDYLPKRDLHVEQLQATLERGLEWARSEADAQTQRSRVHELSEGLPQLIWTSLPDGRCDFLNRRWYEYTGRERDEQLGLGWLDQVHPDDQARLIADWSQSLETGKELHTHFRIRRHDGQYRWFDTRATAQRDGQGAIIRWLGSNTDVHDVEVMRQELAHSEQRFHAAFDYAPLGMALVNMEGEILQANTAFHHLLGYEHAIAADDGPLIGTSILRISHADDVGDEKRHLLELQSKKIPFVQFEKRMLANDEQIIPTQVSVALISQSAHPPCYLYQFFDLSERKRYEDELIKLAHYDSLTGLGNRAKLNEDINYLIQKSHRIASSFAVLFGDLDHFKQVNDGLGHEAGDLLLRTVARRLERVLRRGDSVARLGGDEFVILLQGITRYESVVTVAEKLIKRVKRPVRLGKNVVHVGMSLGIALYPTDGDDAQTLLRNADSALYDAKSRGRGGYQLYRKELTVYVHNRLMLDADLRNALARQEFELHFQPVVDIQTRRVHSVEALIRWHHPTRGMVAPDEFIPYAQETGLINAIGDWIIDAACAQASRWRQQGIHTPIAINISARQFLQNNLLQILTAAVARQGIEPGDLILEITEQLFLENTQDNIRQINALKSEGFNISLDDFGTGYSSLSYIIRFAPHFLKIDRSFVNRIGAGAEHDAMVNAIIGLNKIQPMIIVAEGVETPEQQAFLAQRGCDLAQGYLYFRPLPASQLDDILRELMPIVVGG